MNGITREEESISTDTLDAQATPRHEVRITGAQGNALFFLAFHGGDSGVLNGW